MLRIANSPFYGTLGEIITMSQAVMTLGVRTVRALALSTSIYDYTGQWVSQVSSMRFWKHSLQTAIASRMIAEEIEFPHPEEAFICGLLHDLGVLLLEQSCPESFVTVWQKVESRSSLSEEEMVNWRTLHSQVGYAYFTHWKMPEILRWTVRDHHDIALDGKGETISAIVALAELVSPFTITALCDPLPRDLEVRKALMDLLKISHAELETLQKVPIIQTVNEGAFLEIDIGSPDSILMEANRLIHKQYLEAAKELYRSHMNEKEERLLKLQNMILHEANNQINLQRLKIGRLLREKKGGNRGDVHIIALDTNTILCDLYREMDLVLKSTEKKLMQVEEFVGNPMPDTV
jgi:hypothetical protein